MYEKFIFAPKIPYTIVEKNQYNFHIYDSFSLELDKNELRRVQNICIHMQIHLIDLDNNY